MNQNISNYLLFEQLGECLEYPTQTTKAILADMESHIMAVSNIALFNFQEFAANINKLEMSTWQECYVRTFDVMPLCGLYLSVYLFGEENYKRSELMTGLKSIYDTHGEYGMSELPDHLAVILKKNSLFSAEEWSELVSMCLIPAMPKLIKILEKNNSPYGFLIKTIQELLVNTEKVYA